MEDKLGKEWIEDWYKRNLIEWKKEGIAENAVPF